MKKQIFFWITFLFLNTAIAQNNNEFEIQLTTETFTPTEKTISDLEQPISEHQYFDNKYFKLIQFYNLPNANERATLRASGLYFIDYIPNKTYHVVIRKGFDLSSIQNNIRAIFDNDTRFKLDASIYHDGIPAHAFTEHGKVKLAVGYYSHLKVNKVLSALQQFGKITEHHAYARQLTIEIQQEQFDDLLDLPFVQFVGAPEKAPKEENVHWESNGRSNYVSSNFNGLNFNGEGDTVCVSEGGYFDINDFEWKGRVTQEVPTGSGSTHKNNVAKRQVAGGNYRPYEKGVAWGAHLLFASTIQYDSLYLKYNAKYINHSYGYGIEGAYNSAARFRDLFVLNYPNAVISYSVGNDATKTGYAPYNGFSGWANISGAAKENKNNFAVASVDRADNLMWFSTRGPSYDGRIIPQIATAGEGGTSYATPKLIGTLAVLSQAYKHYHTAQPTSSLLKAVVLNTADDVDNAGIDFKTGFGRANTRRAHDVIQANQIITSSVDNGNSNTHTVNVPVGTKQVRVLVYWADEAAAINVAKALVNDLDLKVTDASGTNFSPWVLSHFPHPDSLNALPVRMSDHLNNVEQVTIDNPVAGNYTFTVSGYNVPFGPQQYYLVYEFLEDELHLTYPKQGDKLVSGWWENIQIDNYGGSTSNVLIEYQLDGGTWQTIASVAPNAPAHNWQPPSVTGIQDLKIRVSRDGLSSESYDCTIGAMPNNLKMSWTCNNKIALEWDAVAGATGYKVYTMGQKYMEEIAPSDIIYNGTSAVISNIDLNEKNLFAVSALTNTKEGRRTQAYKFYPANVKTFAITPTSTDSDCSLVTGTATVDAISNVTYAWSNGGNTNQLTGLAPGTYTVTASTSEGCSDTQSVTIGKDGIAATNPIHAFNGNTGSVTAYFDSPFTPHTYSWSNGGNTQTISNLAPGPYGVTITDPNGCSGTALALVADETPCDAPATLTNIALGKPTSASTIFAGREPSRAVDGNTSGIYNDNSIAQTVWSPESWWEVDLESIQNIHEITIWNLTQCCQTNLKEFYVFVSKYPFATNDVNELIKDDKVYHIYQSAYPTPTLTLSGLPDARYVRIQHSKPSRTIILAEVQVWRCDAQSLPVDLLHFSGKAINQQTELNWEIANALNFLKFEVERSHNGIDFEKIGTVDFNENLNNYQFIDETPFDGINYYRLKMLDIDGSFEYSNTIEVYFENIINPTVHIFPNPAKDHLTIESTDFIGQTIQVSNITGQIVKETKHQSTSTHISINDLPSGTYFVKTETVVQKVIIQK